jgi:tRNA(Arg) A34 adenosine deaminase TadA
LVRNEEAEVTAQDEATEADRELLRQAIKVADDAVRHGNHPFGALLTDSDGQVVLTAENTVVTDDDVTGHAETNLVRHASRTIGRTGLADYTLYTSCEPCAMCSGAIYWAGIHRVVYALAETSLLALTGSHAENPTLKLPCREVFAGGQRTTIVVGPLLEEEAAEAHQVFWH